VCVCDSIITYTHTRSFQGVQTSQDIRDRRPLSATPSEYIPKHLRCPSWMNDIPEITRGHHHEAGMSGSRESSSIPTDTSLSPDSTSVARPQSRITPVKPARPREPFPRKSGSTESSPFRQSQGPDRTPLVINRPPPLIPQREGPPKLSPRCLWHLVTSQDVEEREGRRSGQTRSTCSSPTVIGGREFSEFSSGILDLKIRRRVL